MRVPPTSIGGMAVWGGHISRRLMASEAGGYIVAEVSKVHLHECRAWRFGRRNGPCTCGADVLWEDWAERQGNADPFAAIRTPDSPGRLCARCGQEIRAGGSFGTIAGASEERRYVHLALVAGDVAPGCEPAPAVLVELDDRDEDER